MCNLTENPHRNHHQNSLTIVTENHHRKQRAFSLPCQYYSGYRDLLLFPLEFFYFAVPIYLLVYHILDLTLHCKVEVSFTPLAQYFCMTTLDSALSLPGLRLTKYM